MCLFPLVSKLYHSITIALLQAGTWRRRPRFIPAPQPPNHVTSHPPSHRSPCLMTTADNGNTNNSSNNDCNIKNTRKVSSPSGKAESISSANAPPDSDTILSTSSSPQYTRDDDDDLFVLEDEYPPVDDYLTTETDEDSKIVWNQLPKPSTFIRTLCSLRSLNILLLAFHPSLRHSCYALAQSVRVPSFTS